MKILHIIDSGGLYGAEVMLLNLMSEQVSLGLEPILASLGEKNIEDKAIEVEAGRRGLRVKKFRMSAGPNVFGASDVIRFAHKEKVDLLHSHGYKGNILIGSIPKVIRRTPMVSTVHGWTWTGGWGRMRIYEWLDRLSLRFIDRVVVVNGAMCEKVSLKNLYVVNNGIPNGEGNISGLPEDEKCQVYSEIAAFCRDGFTIGAIGRLSSEKGYDILLNAIKEVLETNHKVRLIILGEGYERGALEVQIKSLGLEKRVLMPGYVANARRYLPLFKVFALSSLTEGLPIVVLEAMQAGVPIVATRVGGVPEVLENGEAGVLVEVSNAHALSEAFSRLINEPEFCQRLANRAMKIVSEKYSSQRMADEYRVIYNGLMKSGPAVNHCHSRMH